MRAIVFLLSFLACLNSTLHAAESTGSERPRVGLVLSGGGARGAAHIGLLKYLEEQRIPIDFIAGTSVGAVIGGLYASGMSASEVEQLIVGLDWNEMFSDGALPAELGIRRKLQRYRYLVDFDAGIEHGELKFATGFIQGQRMQLMLREQTLPVRHIRDFDELPTPFRAVATNLASADALVFAEGDLVQAIRASMSVPGVYSPVEYRGTQLVDGGLVQNLPVPVALDAGMDVLVAMDVATPLREPDKLDSPFAVTEQVIDGVMLNQSRAMRDLLQPGDILIAPEMREYGSADFDAVAEMVKIGYTQAASHAEELAQYAISEAEYEAWRRARELQRRELSRITGIRVESGRHFERLVRARLRQQLQAPLDVDQLHNDLGEVFGLGVFATVGYTLRSDDEGGEVLVVQAEPKDTPTRIETGFELQETFSGNSAFQLRAALNRAGINPLGAEWRTELGLGTVTGLSTEFYQPLRPAGDLFLAANYAYAIGEIATRDDGSGEAEYRLRENVAGLDVGVNLGRWTTTRIGLRYGREDAILQEGDPLLFEDREFDVGDVVFQFRHDTMNSFSFPSEGWRFDLRWQRAQDELGAAEDGEYAGIDTLAAFGDGIDNVLLGATFESVLSGDRFLAEGVALGGVARLSGFERDELVGRHAGLLRAVYYRYLGRDPNRLIDVPLYAGVTLEAGNVWQDSSDVSRGDIIYGAGVFVALDTFLGPISLTYGANSDNKDAFYLSIGTINGPSFRQFRR